MLDLIIYLSGYHVKDLFGESWFSIPDFCSRMGYNRANLQRRLTQKQLTYMFGDRTPPKYTFIDGVGKPITHPIETVFEAALYKLGIENISCPVVGEDGRTSYNFVQILKRFDIKTDFNTRKLTKRLYSAVLSPEIKDFMFSLYNLLELQDYKNLPSKYRYFYLELSKMVYLIKHKIKNNEPPFYVLTVDQLAKKFDIEIPEAKYRKKKVVSVLRKMNEYLKYTNFNFSFVKGENERWAYTVAFTFTQDTLQHFDEGQMATMTKRFYSNLLRLYAEITYPEKSILERTRCIKVIENDTCLYKEFLSWANSSKDLQKKEQLYVNDYVAVYGRTPEGLPNVNNHQVFSCLSTPPMQQEKQRD